MQKSEWKGIISAVVAFSLEAVQGGFLAQDAAVMMTIIDLAIQKLIAVIDT